MMTIWETLDIDATSDDAAIRRAYARQLKLHRPDKDPQGYQELREAFDLAKRYASGMTLWQTDAVEEDEQPVAASSATEDYLQLLEKHHDVDLHPGWQHDALEDDAERFSVRLLADEFSTLNALRHYLEHELPDALEARSVFSQALAQALSQREGITRGLINAVSEIMGWGLENYRARQLSGQVIEALETQIALSEANDYWAFLSRQGDEDGDRQAKLAWRILSGEIRSLPWWTRLIPGFIQVLTGQLSTIKQYHPQLLARVDPALQQSLATPALALSWDGIVVLWFWGFSLWLEVSRSPSAVWQAAVMLVMIVIYLWGVPLLLEGYAQRKVLARVLLPFFWLLGWVIMAVPLFHLGQLLFSYPPTEKGPARLVMFGVVLAYPAWWLIRRNLYRWYAMPLKGVSTMIMLPILFLRNFSPAMAAVGILLLPIFFSHVIRWLFFFG
ncbi:J domain-containing protein [Kosakonia sp. ML.JS2a]|uniref:J domain-containing protein n=1 Tax=Kosakonia sp. ML.JS2a TaxID=2980557 RepID=UPI0021D8C123|nr:J domain-containing protein [Kosakonia sp. ML.JS2a]UXY09946.1 J domain-containing protein [Kosakonia sp. ML.JS2a]